MTDVIRRTIRVLNDDLMRDVKIGRKYALRMEGERALDDTLAAVLETDIVQQIRVEVLVKDRRFKQEQGQ